VLTSTGVQAGSRTRCHGCLLHINIGDPFVRLRLQKRFRFPCATCTVAPKASKRYHTACEPVDKHKAMGFDPNVHGHAPATPLPNGGAVAPPPRPPTVEETALLALIALETALVTRAAHKGVTPELESAFKKFQGIKARVLRPGTPAEGEVATSLAIQQIVKLVYA